MAMAELNLSTKTHVHSSQLSFLSRNLPRQRQCSFAPLHRTTQHARISCSVAPNQVQVPAVQTQDPKTKPECYGVFCLTYDLKAEEETRSWKKLINIAVSGAAGMISNHLLFKIAKYKEALVFEG